MRRKYRRSVVKVALVYPSTYRVAMSSAVFHILYFKLQDVGFYVERFTTDGGARGIEEGTPLSHFDYVLAPVHYELDYLNLIKLLREGGIELWAKVRRGPKIVLGGPPLTANPEPLAELADLIVLGELEAVWGKLVDYMTSGVEVDGVGLYYPTHGAVPVSIAWSDSPEVDYRRLPEPQSAFSLSVELARGCPYACLFCMESYITKPYRPRDVERVLEEAESLYKRGVRPSLIALTANAHPQFKKLLESLTARGVPMSFPSLRAELLDEEAVELLYRAGQRTLTIAPETGERLRTALGKRITDTQVLRVVEKAAGLGMKIKMYLMVGVPCEREEDLAAVEELVREVKKRGARLYLSVNPLVPKPQTPLQYHPMAPLGELKRKIQRLRETPHDQFSHYNPKLAAVQAAIALGGREVFQRLVAGSISRGGWWSYVFSPRREPLPWSHVRGYYSPERLWEMYLRYLGEACG